MQSWSTPWAGLTVLGRRVPRNIARVVSTSVSFLFFFFQAEDGIRDADVTGVQTCALPISNLAVDAIHGSDPLRSEVVVMEVQRARYAASGGGRRRAWRCVQGWWVWAGTDRSRSRMRRGTLATDIFPNRTPLDEQSLTRYLRHMAVDGQVMSHRVNQVTRNVPQSDVRHIWFRACNFCGQNAQSRRPKPAGQQKLNEWFHGPGGWIRPGQMRELRGRSADPGAGVVEDAPPGGLVGPVVGVPAQVGRAQGALRVRHQDRGAAVLAAQPRDGVGGTVGIGRVPRLAAVAVDVAQRHLRAGTIGFGCELRPALPVRDHDRDPRAGHAGQQHRRRAHDFQHRQPRLELLADVALEAWPVPGTGDDAAKLRHHLAAVAHPERERVRAMEERLEGLAQLRVLKDRSRPAASGAEHVAVA